MEELFRFLLIFSNWFFSISLYFDSLPAIYFARENCSKLIFLGRLDHLQALTFQFQDDIDRDW